jgi:hypothetical protein
MIADRGLRDAQLGSDLAQGPALGVQIGCTLNIHCVTVTAQCQGRVWRPWLSAESDRPRGIRWSLGCDVLVEVEEVAGIVGSLDLD